MMFIVAITKKNAKISIVQLCATLCMINNFFKFLFDIDLYLHFFHQVYHYPCNSFFKFLYIYTLGDHFTHFVTLF